MNAGVTRQSPVPPTSVLEVPLSPALRARVLGAGLAAIGVVLVVAVLLTWLGALPRAVTLGLVVLSLAGVLALGLLVARRPWVLRLDEDGYRVRLLSRRQARSARWSDVQDLQAARVRGARVAVLRLRDGRTTTLPVDALAGDPDRLTRTLSEHLDAGHGYRRLR